MKVLSSKLELTDIRTSWHSVNHIPISTFTYHRLAASTLTAAFRRTIRGRGKIAASASSGPAVRSPEIRRPRERSGLGGGGGLSSVSTSGCWDEAVSDMDLFLELVPLRMRNDLFRHQEIGELIEVVMDLGRKPLARFPTGDWVMSEQAVQLEDLQHAISKIGDFSDDNRSGINRSLHRISAIRNRKMQVIGLTCRVGRAVSGSAEMLRDLVEGGGSILVIGPPGVGKTTLIREIARILADDQYKRVVIVDTSNEIGGDGDVPHSGIGRSRRMQVPNVSMQHNVMIEAVENHMPQTIIIDEIGTELEALAASTIAQRGVQLVATAHGVTIESIIKNPSLQILVGGIESVTLGDEEARKRKVQKTILERKGPPTFTCAVEMISRTECRVHHRLDSTVDAILAGRSPLFEIRQTDNEASDSLKSSSSAERDLAEDSKLAGQGETNEVESDDQLKDHRKKTRKLESERYVRKRDSPVSIYSFKIQDADLSQVAAVMGVVDELNVTDDVAVADAILASSSEMKKNPWIRGIAKFHQIPIFVIKSNTMAQIVKAIRMILGMDTFGSKTEELVKDTLDIEIGDDAPKRKPSLEEIDALEEVRLAIEYIVIPGGEAVELLPRRSEIVALQLELVKSYQLAAENSGTESNPRLQILPHKLDKGASKSAASIPAKSAAGLPRLPLLPE